MKKQIHISASEVSQYKQITGYKGSNWPQAFLLTLWSYFTVPELRDKEHLLVEQHIDCLNEIQLDEEYDVSLVRTETIAKEKIAFWTYSLQIRKEDMLYAECKTKIYVKIVSSI
ncbi:hypothetical protein [Enterococcus sp. DIV1420a]|uniref:hypothetical protein n=1 Tax=Enterococcus TaxID=1350 RepID=UPI0036D6BCBA